MAEKKAKKQTSGRRLKFSVKQVLEAINDSAGIKSEVAKRLNCSRAMIYEYIERFPEVKKAFEDEEEKVLDMAESSLFSLIQDSEMSAIFYYLNNKGRKRGYGASQRAMSDAETDKAEERKTGVLITPGLVSAEAWEQAAQGQKEPDCKQ